MKSTAVLEAIYADLKTDIDIQKGKRDALKNQLEHLNEKYRQMEQEEKLLQDVTILLQKSADYARSQAKNQVEELVTKCLHYIFEEDSELVIEFSENGRIPTAAFYVQSNYDGYTTKTRPEISRGGGVVDAISLALRIAFLEAHSPPIEGPLFLDEPGKHVSDDYIFNLGEFIKECSSMFDRQIIMVTHNEHLAQICDLTYVVEIRNGKTELQKKVDIR